MDNPTIYRTLLARLSPDLLVTLYDAAYCAGAGLPSDPPADPLIAGLLTTIADRHRAEYLAARGWLDPVVTSDDLPGWFLAHCERQVLSDARPPEGWLRKAGSDGKP